MELTQSQNRIFSYNHNPIQQEEPIFSFDLNTTPPMNTQHINKNQITPPPNTQMPQVWNPQDSMPWSNYQTQQKQQQQPLAYDLSGSSSSPDNWLDQSARQQTLPDLEHAFGLDMNQSGYFPTTQGTTDTGFTYSPPEMYSTAANDYVSSNYASSMLNYPYRTDMPSPTIIPQNTNQYTQLPQSSCWPNYLPTTCYNTGQPMQSFWQSPGSSVPKLPDWLEKPTKSLTTSKRNSLKREADDIPKGLGTAKRFVRSKNPPPMPMTPGLHSELIRLVHRMGPRDMGVWIQKPVREWEAVCVGGTDADRVRTYGTQDIQLKINETELWTAVNSRDTEMITTTIGRRIYPALSVSVSGLEPEEKYIFFMDMVMVQSHILKHQHGNWTVSGQAEEYPPKKSTLPMIYLQEDSPKSGRSWMESGVNFVRAKITNNKDANQFQNMIYIYSMHQYIPRYHIARERHPAESAKIKSEFGVDADRYELVGSYIIPGTQFYTVTAYQNPDVIHFKVNHNPFAKGFRNRPEEFVFSDSNH